MSKTAQYDLKENYDWKDIPEELIDIIVDNDQLSPLIGVALLLDPRKKKAFLREIGWSDDWIASAILSLQASFDFYKPVESTAVVETPDETLNSYEMFKRRKMIQNSATEDAEIERYMSVPPISDKINPLLWWKTNELVYPTLAKVARDYFSIQASSVPSERVFSSGVDLVTPDRCRLSGEVIERTQFMKYALSKRKV